MSAGVHLHRVSDKITFLNNLMVCEFVLYTPHRRNLAWPSLSVAMLVQAGISTAAMCSDLQTSKITGNKQAQWHPCI